VFRIFFINDVSRRNQKHHSGHRCESTKLPGDENKIYRFRDGLARHNIEIAGKPASKPALSFYPVFHAILVLSLHFNLKGWLMNFVPTLRRWLLAI
jgi:hypothetical protein